MPSMHNVLLFLVGALSASSAADKTGTANTWRKLDRAVIAGRRWDVPLGYAPGRKRFIVLGGRSTYGDYRKPRSYDVLTLHPQDKTWENDFPPGKDWGPKVGVCTAPAWQGEVWSFRDLEGNLRPNWTVYGT